MTTLSITAPSVTTTSGFSAVSGPKSVGLQWNFDPTIKSYEVWRNTSNTSGTATKIASPLSNFYADTGLTTGTTYYYWIKNIDQYGTASAFSSSVNAIPTAFTSSDTAASSASSSGTSVGGSTSTPTVSTYGTWYDCGYAGWTAGANDIIQLCGFMITTVSAVTSTGTDLVNAWARVRLYDATAAANVPGATYQQLLYHNFGGFPHGNTDQISNFNDKFVSGFRGLLVPGHSYEWHFEVMKEQTGSAALTLAVNSVGTSSSVASVT